MADPLDDLRHPDFEDAARLWRTVIADVNLAEPITLDAVPDLPNKSNLLQYGGAREMPLSPLYRPIVLGCALRTLAKALETFKNAEACRAAGATASSLLLYYDSVYLAGRSLSMLLGFNQVGRSSEVSVDVFARVVNSKGGGSEEVARFFVYGLWGHDNLWKLIYRLLRTAKRIPLNETALKYFRSDKFDKFSQIRNRQIYSDAHLYAGDVEADADFPMEVVTLPESQIVVCYRYQQAFENLMSLISIIVAGSAFEKTLFQISAAERSVKWLKAA